MMTAAQMNRISKEATAAELQKLHVSIAENPSLARQCTRKSSGLSAGSEASFSSDTSESEEEEPKKLTLAHVFFCNQTLQRKNRKIACKLVKCKNECHAMEVKYEQIRITNSQQHIQLNENAETIQKLQKSFAAAICLAFSIAFYCLF